MFIVLESDRHSKIIILRLHKHYFKFRLGGLINYLPKVIFWYYI